MSATTNDPCAFFVTAVDRIAGFSRQLIRFVVVAAIMAVCSAPALAIWPGQLDPTFGTFGTVTLPFGPNGLLDYSWADVAVQPDGRIVVAGTVIDATFNADFAIARLLPDGSLDPGFGVNGEVRIAFDFGADNSDLLTCLAIQEDGKIVVAGTVQFGVDDFDFGIARLEPNGALDPSFGFGAGISTVAFDLGWSLEDRPWDMAIQPDGKIVLVGAAAIGPPSDFQFAVARLNGIGNLDASFGAAGRVVVPFDLGGNDYDVATSVELLPDGKIVIAGWADVATVDSDFAVVQLGEDGSLDPGFGAGGKVLVAFNLGGYNLDSAFAVAAQPDGRIVVAGGAQSAPDADYEFAFAGLLPDGSLDPGFGFGGRTVIQVDLGYELNDWIYDIEIQADGKIVGAGSVELSSNDTDFAVIRLTENGLVDPAYGISFVAFDLGGGGAANWDEAYALALQPDNNVVVVGVVDEDLYYDHLGVARLLNDLVHADGFESGSTSKWSAAVPPQFCIVAFDDAYAVFGQGSNPEAFYGPIGVHFDNTFGFGVIGGISHGDPGNWNIEGTNGPAAYGLWEGPHSIHFDEPVVGLSFDTLRGNIDLTVVLEAYLGGTHVGTQVLALNGPFAVETAFFPGPVDEITWDTICCWGMDNIVFNGLPWCQ